MCIRDRLYTEHVDRSAPVFALLVWCFTAVCTTYVFGSLLTAGGDLRALNWMAAGGALLNITLNLFFIPRWQVEGAAWAGLITQVLTAVVQMVLAMRLHKVTGVVPVLVRGAIYAGVLVAVDTWLGRVGLDFVWTTLTFGAIALMVATFTGLLSPKELRKAMA